jgi:hypothetical protein
MHDGARLAIIALLAVMLSACSDRRADSVLRDSELARERCELLHVPARAVEDSVTRIRDLPSPPCEMRFRQIAALQGDPTGRVPYPGAYAAMDSRGHLYTDSDTPGVVAIWDSTGVFLRALGRRGAGPGELEGSVVPYIGPHDRLYVRSQNRWSTFDSTGAFRAAIRTRFIAPSSVYTIVLDDERTISADAGFARVPEARFVVADADGALVRSFGARSPDEIAPQPITYGGGEAFWSAVRYEHDGNYKLEQWDTAGRLLRKVVRSASWLPEMPHKTGRYGVATDVPRVVVRPHVEPGGLLIVVIWINEEFRMELLDPDSGLLLASAVDSKSEQIPTDFLRAHRTAYRVGQDSLGIPALLIFRYSVAAR